jgi:hypothetical protein
MDMTYSPTGSSGAKSFEQAATTTSAASAADSLLYKPTIFIINVFSVIVGIIAGGEHMERKPRQDLRLWLDINHFTACLAHSVRNIAIILLIGVIFRCRWKKKIASGSSLRLLCSSWKEKTARGKAQGRGPGPGTRGQGPGPAHTHAHAHKKAARIPGTRAACLSVSLEGLLLASLVTLVELVHTAGGVDDLHLAGVEGVRSVGNLKLHKRILNTFDSYRLLCVGATAGDEYIFVGHILESYKSVGFGMDSLFHKTSFKKSGAKIMIFWEYANYSSSQVPSSV